MIGDTVTFTNLIPHKFRITGRTKHFINTFGEEVIIENAEKALSTASSKTGALITDYTAGPYYMSATAKGHHEWIIEFETEPEEMELFINILDNSLKALNSDYEAKRFKDMTLTKPSVIVAPKGTFYRWLEKKNKLGGQNKVPRLSNDRQYLDELLEFM